MEKHKSDTLVRVFDVLLNSGDEGISQNDILNKLEINLKTLLSKLNTLYYNDFEIKRKNENFVFKGKKGYSVQDLKTIVKNAYLKNDMSSDLAFLLSFYDIKSLNLIGENFYDLSFLEKYTQLNILRLECEKVIDYTFLENLKSVKYLRIINAINCKTFASFSKLENLYDLEIKNLNANCSLDLKNTKLKCLKLQNVGNISKIVLPKELTCLGLLNTQIDNFDFLNNSKIKLLQLANNKNVKDYSFLYTLTNLKFLSLDKNLQDIIDIEKIKFNNPFLSIRFLDVK